MATKTLASGSLIVDSLIMTKQGIIIALCLAIFAIAYLHKVANKRLLSDAALLYIMVLGILLIAVIGLLVIVAILSFLSEHAVMQLISRVLFESIILGVSMMFGVVLPGAIWYIKHKSSGIIPRITSN